ncbi:MAG: hypothetical protein IJQ30_06105, partial [Acidaminococcaceae bacterium]|nr:hypothetical protein [Acidaminococcaceae bacterium]
FSAAGFAAKPDTQETVNRNAKQTMKSVKTFLEIFVIFNIPALLFYYSISFTDTFISSMMSDTKQISLSH